MTNTKDLIEQIAQRYGISADDPLLMSFVAVESEANNVVEECRKLVDTVQQEYTTVYSSALSLIATVEKIQRSYKFRLAMAMSLAVLSFALGNVVGFFFVRFIP